MAKLTIEIDAELKDLIPQFLENRKKDIQSLRALVVEGDFNGISQLSHRIKGATASYGFLELSEYAANIEKHAKNQNLQPLGGLVEQMEAHLFNLEIRYVHI